MTVRPRARVALAATVLLLLAAGAGAQDGPGRLMPDRGRDHVQTGTPIPYQDVPPTSGPHWPVVARWAVYQEAIPEEVLVHNLEHGGIVWLYRCPTPCPDVVRRIQEVVTTLPKSKYGYVKLVVSPNARMTSRFALLAWRRLDEFDTLDPERVVRFVRAWQDKGPEDVP